MTRAAGGTLDQPVTLVLVDDAGEPISEPVVGWLRFVAESPSQLVWHLESPSPLVTSRSSRSGSNAPIYCRGAVHAYVNNVLYCWHDLPQSMAAGEILTLPDGQVADAAAQQRLGGVLK
jgi:hypothetical protein